MYGMRWVVLIVLCFGSGCSIFGRKEAQGSIAAAPVDSMWPAGRAPIARPTDKQAGIMWGQACVGNPSAAPDANSYVKVWSSGLDGFNASSERRRLYTTGNVAMEFLSRASWGASVGGTVDYRFEDGALVLLVGQHPQYLYHWWFAAMSSTVWRVAIPSDIVKIVGVAEVQCFGDARIQLGADWWTSVNSPPGTQTEAYASPWIDASAGRIVLSGGP